MKPSPDNDSEMGRRRAAAQAEGGAAYQSRRAEVIKAAAKVFKERGYRAASLGDVAVAVGTDRASLYYYVSGKRELFDEVVSDAVLSNVLEAEAIRDGDGTPAEKLRRMVVAIMSAYEEHYPYLYVFVQEDLSRPGADGSAGSRAVVRLGRRYDDAVTAVVQAGLDDGTLRSEASAHVIAYGIIGMVNWSHRWFRPRGQQSGTQVGEALADMVIGGLLSRSD